MARYTLLQRDTVYRIYVTDALKAIAHNTAQICGGSYLEQRYADVILGRGQAADAATAEEIIEEVVRNAGIEVV